MTIKLDGNQRVRILQNYTTKQDLFLDVQNESNMGSSVTFYNYNLIEIREKGGMTQVFYFPNMEYYNEFVNNEQETKSYWYDAKIIYSNLK